jgi:DNA repair protein RadC
MYNLYHKKFKNMEYAQEIEKSANLAEVSLTYKSKVKVSNLPKIGDSKDVESYLRECFDPNTIEHVESFVILLLNRANNVLGWCKISQGGVAGTVADPKVIFQVAISANASAIILSHNHPSGNFRPSDTDLSMTNKLKEPGNLLDIQVLDHVILTSEGSYSFADNGKM